MFQGFRDVAFREHGYILRQNANHFSPPDVSVLGVQAPLRHKALLSSKFLRQ